MATSSRWTYGGYSYNFVDSDPPDEYLCHICTLVARDPQQVTCCYNIYCKSCLDTLKEKGQGFICPTCRSSLEGKYFKDGRVERGIKSLKVYCTNTDSGCRWMGTIKDIDTHLNSCIYQLVHCTNECGVKIKRSKLETHLTDKCPKRLVNCRYCKQEGTYQVITSISHLKECPDLPYQCSNEGCHEKIPRHSLGSHNETCPKAIIPCEYNTVGCNKKMKREEQEKHNEESMKQHLDIAMKKIDAMQHSSNQQVFKLHGYKDKKEEDKKWYSPGFYTSPGGYKMSLRVDPNGNGKGKGTHVSCFMCLEAGEYDDTLEWPFQGEVTIELLNQLEDKNHKKENVSFDESTPGQGKERVNEGRNTVGMGHQKFIPHEAWEFEYNPFTNCQYLKDDSLYFRVSVKATSKTKPWLALT
ncbi:PREDICTED: TNF receptor-associated factor 5-like [Amphimedon queenslandica]|uniref:RING-type E3 ubiquitin transferase n=1 Tax=Amphimedon queenslandica TaxID=400682 RepID=A0A1X7U802_AMPQE|nr:PREDICTED: TNF receptor-associated factor 5-like [Amphimedon queenslandica]|eukprot:XP_003388778.1 PREDICTED: TNF receptor-associated factor 5-like [Amphimedon queenslandica]